MALPKVTQENVHIFIPLKVTKVVERIAKNEEIDIKISLIRFLQL